jgi:hypothetical protein
MRDVDTAATLGRRLESHVRRRIGWAMNIEKREAQMVE